MPNSFEDQHFQEQAVNNNYPDHYQPTPQEYTAVYKQQAGNFANELVDLITRYNFSLLPGLGTAQDDLLNALAKINLLKEQL